MKIDRKLVAVVVLALFCFSVLCNGQNKADSSSKKKQLRDPFWPVGWEPPSDAPVDTSTGRRLPPKPVKSPEQKWKEAAKELKVTGIVKQPSTGKYMAMVSGFGIVEEGDIIWVKRGGLKYRWQVEKVTEEGLIQKKIDALPDR